MRFATRVARIQKLFIPRNVEKGKAFLPIGSLYFFREERKGRGEERQFAILYNE
jgi:hypothetical protein